MISEFEYEGRMLYFLKMNGLLYLKEKSPSDGNPHYAKLSATFPESFLIGIRPLKEDEFWGRDYTEGEDIFKFLTKKEYVSFIQTDRLNEGSHLMNRYEIDSNRIKIHTEFL